jgi:hypothetical protein
MSAFQEESSQAIAINSFMYLNVFVHNMPVTALLDSGSSINVISFSFFQLLPESEKAEFSFCEDSIILANNQRVTVYGTAKVRIRKKLSDNGHFKTRCCF